jgi:hypothetical protein
LLPGLGGQGAVDTEVVGIVDGRLGSQRTTFLEVLLDLAVLVVRLDDRLDAFGDDLRLEPAGVLLVIFRSNTIWTLSGRPRSS